MPETKCEVCPVCSTPVAEMDKLVMDNIIIEDPYEVHLNKGVLSTYKGKCVALHRDLGLIANGDTLKDVLYHIQYDGDFDIRDVAFYTIDTDGKEAKIEQVASS